MNLETLNYAINMGQLLALLTPAAGSSKPFNKGLSRVRSGLQEQVIIAALQADTEAGKRAALRIRQIQEALLTSMRNYLDMAELLRCSHTKQRFAHPRHIVKKDGVAGHAMLRLGCEEALFSDVLAFKLVPSDSKLISQAQGSKVAHAYSSAVRNSGWLPTLMQLNVGMAVATEENVFLSDLHGSHQGREKLEENLQLLCPSYSSPSVKSKRTAKKVVSAEGLYAVQVVLTVEKLLAQKDIAELASAMPPKGSKLDSTKSLTDLLNTATQPRILGDLETAADVAQALVDELVTGLLERKKAIDAELSKAKAEASEAVKAEAVKALKSMSPKLLKALKENPDLLKAL